VIGDDRTTATLDVWTPDAELDAGMTALLPTPQRGNPKALADLIGAHGWTPIATGGTRLAYLNANHPGVLLKLAYRPSGQDGNAREARHWQDLITHRHLTGQAHPQQERLFPVLWTCQGAWLLAMPKAEITLQKALGTGELTWSRSAAIQDTLIDCGLRDVVTRNVGRLGGQWRLFDYGHAPRWATTAPIIREPWVIRRNGTD